jgi:hypothetical protein
MEFSRQCIDDLHQPLRSAAATVGTSCAVATNTHPDAMMAGKTTAGILIGVSPVE